ncbi:MAG: hypothetical protein RLZZ385_2030 [Pseudomonadota bacterium]
MLNHALQRSGLDFSHRVRVPALRGTAADSLTLSDGHTLAYQIYGSQDGFPVFYFHSVGNSRLECELFHRSASRTGFRLIAVDRPGIGGSDPRANGGTKEFARAIVELADRLEITRFGMLSLASGGLFALSTAHQAQDRIEFQLSLGGIPGNLLQHRAGQGSSLTAHCMNSVLPLLIRVFTSLRHSLSVSSPDDYVERLRDLLSYTDRKALEDPRVMAVLKASLGESLRQGFQGVARDTSLCFAEPGFQLRDIRVPVVIWQGCADRLYPNSSSEYVTAHLPRGSLHSIANRGHYFFLHCMDEIFASVSHLEPSRQTWRAKAA